jgi:hypothetical protein
LLQVWYDAGHSAARRRNQLPLPERPITPLSFDQSTGIGERHRSGVTSMITIPSGARILLATRPIDFRKGGHSLAALAQAVLAEDPFLGSPHDLSEIVR